MLEGVALLLLAISALAFQRAATAPWAETLAGDGRQIQVSPIGVIDFGPGGGSTPPSECRWWPRLGDESLCAVASQDAMTTLRRAYPLAVMALWIAVLAIFLNALRIPLVPRAVGAIVAAVVPAFGLLALQAVFIAAPKALSILAGLQLAPASIGFGSVVAGTVCSAAAAVLLVSSGRR
jgi:hypothetical protein